MSPEYIVLHHSLTKDSGTVSWGAIRRHHTSPYGPYRFQDIGYHWGIELIDASYEILMGRFPDQPGAHAKEAGMNKKSLGVCLIGNFDEAPPNDAQLHLTRRLVHWLQLQFGIPTGRVLGHREVGLLAGFDWTKGQYKSCPGRAWNLETFRDSLDDDVQWREGKTVP